MHVARPIGIFDSGVGGLSVVKALLRQMPDEHFIYYGDTAHVPYGEKTVEQLFSYARHIIRYFLVQGVKAIIVACGSQSSNTLPTIEKESPVPIVGILKPGIQAALQVSANKHIGVLATQATVNSGAYTREILSACPQGAVYETACPAFVPLIEAGGFQGKETQTAVAKVTEAIFDQPFDTLILGCTHYPFLEPLIKAGLRKEIKIIDPAYATIAETKGILQSTGRLNHEHSKPPHRDFVVSGNPDSFSRVGRLLLPDVVAAVRQEVLS